MAQEFLDGGYRNALVNQESGTSVSAGMESDRHCKEKRRGED